MNYKDNVNDLEHLLQEIIGDQSFQALINNAAYNTLNDYDKLNYINENLYNIAADADTVDFERLERFFLHLSGDDQVSSEPVVNEIHTETVSTKKSKKKPIKFKVPRMPQTKPQKVQKSREKEKQSTVSVLMTIAMFIGIAGASYFIWDRFVAGDKLDVFSYYTITPQGESGDASIRIERNEALQLNVATQDILDEVHFSFSSNDALILNQEVVITINESDKLQEKLEQYDVKIKSMSLNYTLSDLKEMRDFDPFEGLILRYEGNNTQGSAKIELLSSSPHLEVFNKLQFNISKDTALSNNDTVKVSLLMDDKTKKLLKDENLKVQVVSKEYTVSGLRFVPSTMQEIPNLDKMGDEMLGRFTKDYTQENATYTNFKQVSACYTEGAGGAISAVDGGSVMFVFSYDVMEDGVLKTYADAYGYSKVFIKDGALREGTVFVSPPYKKLSILEVQNDLKQNDFKCS